jgi:ribulose-5-phosphate 4-epimerase/fuculose-1-phosphate aldolase
MNDTERQLRTDLAACFRLVALHGWDDMIATHISVRIPGPEHHFLINPFGYLFSEITASMLVKIGVDGRKVDNSPYDVNPAGFTIHSAIHMGREDAKCVMHLHTVDGMAVSAMKCGLLPLAQTSMVVCEDLATHEFEGTAFDLGERERLQKDLGDKHALLLWNHGTLTVGETPAEAWFRMYHFEKACALQTRALAAGHGNLHMPLPGITQKTHRIVDGVLKKAANDLAWPALLRRLDREMPDFRT